MRKILISGGQGDWAQDFVRASKSRYLLSTPHRTELNVADPISIERYLHGKNFDVLINNAGTIHPKGILDSDPDEWTKDFLVNIIGAYRLTKKVLENNVSATIIHISSMAGFANYGDWSSYCSSKAALITFSKCIANDGFNSYCVCPGGFDSKFRGKFDLDNSNLLHPEEVTKVVNDILDGRYKRGDLIAIRKNYFKLNPEWKL